MLIRFSLNSMLVMYSLKMGRSSPAHASSSHISWRMFPACTCSAISYTGATPSEAPKIRCDSLVSKFLLVPTLRIAKPTVTDADVPAYMLHTTTCMFQVHASFKFMTWLLCADDDEDEDMDDEDQEGGEDGACMHDACPHRACMLA